MLCFGLWCKCMYNQIVYYIILYICIFNHRREFAHNWKNQQAYIYIIRQNVSWWGATRRKSVSAPLHHSFWPNPVLDDEGHSQWSWPSESLSSSYWSMLIEMIRFYFVTASIFGMLNCSFISSPMTLVFRRGLQKKNNHWTNIKPNYLIFDTFPHQPSCPWGSQWERYAAKWIRPILRQASNSLRPMKSLSGRESHSRNFSIDLW